MSVGKWATVLSMGVLALSASTPVAATAPWQELLSLDCAGNVRAFASNPVLAVALNASIAHSVYSMVTSAVIDRVSCACSSTLSKDQINAGFNLEFGNLLTAIESKVDGGATAAICTGQELSVDAVGRFFKSYSLPSTCTANQYKSGGACTLALPVSAFDLNLQVAVQRCPNVAAGATTKLPSLSLTCSGKACKDLLLPCNSDSDCQGSTCTPFASTTATQIGSAIETALRGANIIHDASAKCSNAYKTNPGLVVFQTLSQAIGAQMSGGAGVSQHASLGFCGVSKYMPVDLFGVKLDIDLSAIPYGYEAVQYLSEAVSFFAPLVNSVASSNLVTVSDSQVTATEFIAWDGKLDDGTTVTAANRLDGTAFFSVANTLTTSLADSGVTSVQLLNVDCNANVAVFNGQPVSMQLQLPRGANKLYQSVFQIVSDLQQCAANGVTVTQDQLYTRWNPISLEWWLSLFTTPSSFSATPLESVLPSLKYLLIGEQQPERLYMPTSCTYSQYATNGQCSLEYDKLKEVFTSRDLTLRANVQRCPSNPAGVPSMSLQCTGTSCNSMLNTISQVKACAQDSDCGTNAAAGACQLFDTTSMDSSIVSTIFSSDKLSSAVETCDSGVKLARNVYDAFRSVGGASAFSYPATWTSTTQFGLCKLDFQTAAPTSLDGITFASTTNTVTTVSGLTAFTPASSGSGTNGGSSSGGSSSGSSSSATASVAAVIRFNVNATVAASPAWQKSTANQIAAAIGVSPARVLVLYVGTTTHRRRLLADASTDVQVVILPATAGDTSASVSVTTAFNSLAQAVATGSPSLSNIGVDTSYIAGISAPTAVGECADGTYTAACAKQYSGNGAHATHAPSVGALLVAAVAALMLAW